jgi:hypothetical protein
MNRKAAQQMMWIIISAILAVLVLAVYSYMTGGIVRNATDIIFSLQDGSEERAKCQVFPGSINDPDGDGIRNDLPECEKYAQGP